MWVAEHVQTWNVMIITPLQNIYKPINWSYKGLVFVEWFAWWVERLWLCNCSAPAYEKLINTTFSNGCLGSHNDEERSEMRYVMRIARLRNHQNFERTLRFQDMPGSMLGWVSVNPARPFLISLFWVDKGESDYDVTKDEGVFINALYLSTLKWVVWLLESNNLHSTGVWSWM